MALSLPIQRLLLGEAALNIAGAAGMIFAPQRVLSLITTGPIRTPDTAAVQLLRLLGGLFVGLTIPMLFALPNGTNAGAKRFNVYLFLLSGEACLIPVLTAQALMGSKGVGGVTSTSLLVAAANLVPFAAVRAWVMMRKQEWFLDGEGESSRSKRN